MWDMTQVGSLAVPAVVADDAEQRYTIVSGHLDARQDLTFSIRMEGLDLNKRTGATTREVDLISGRYTITNGLPRFTALAINGRPYTTPDVYTSQMVGGDLVIQMDTDDLQAVRFRRR
jgi:hypothetical protein